MVTSELLDSCSQSKNHPMETFLASAGITTVHSIINSTATYTSQIGLGGGCSVYSY